MFPPDKLKLELQLALRRLNGRLTTFIVRACGWNRGARSWFTGWRIAVRGRSR